LIADEFLLLAGFGGGFDSDWLVARNGFNSTTLLYKLEIRKREELLIYLTTFSTMLFFSMALVASGISFFGARSIQDSLCSFCVGTRLSSITSGFAGSPCSISIPRGGVFTIQSPTSSAVVAGLSNRGGVFSTHSSSSSSPVLAVATWGCVFSFFSCFLFFFLSFFLSFFSLPFLFLSFRSSL